MNWWNEPPDKGDWIIIMFVFAIACLAIILSRPSNGAWIKTA